MIWYARLPSEGKATSPVTLFSYCPLGVRNEVYQTYAIDMRAAVKGEHPAYGTLQLMEMPPMAIQNSTPFRPVRQVWAGGGVVVRQRGEEVEILTIKRRGLWDLPKGKQDAGESIHHCAIREVCEEVGATQVSRMSKLGITSHGYNRGGFFMAKTTHWFLMTTEETSFSPQQAEDIVEVAWMPYMTAKDRLGYPSLREALRRWESAVREQLSTGSPRGITS